MRSKENISMGKKLIHQTRELHCACGDWRHAVEDQKSRGKSKSYFTAECQYPKDDTKQTSVETFKSNQLLQGTTTQVLSQIKSDAINEDKLLLTCSVKTLNYLCRQEL